MILKAVLKNGQKVEKISNFDNDKNNYENLMFQLKKEEHIHHSEVEKFDIG